MLQGTARKHGVHTISFDREIRDSFRKTYISIWFTHNYRVPYKDEFGGGGGGDKNKKINRVSLSTLRRQANSILIDNGFEQVCDDDDIWNNWFAKHCLRLHCTLERTYERCIYLVCLDNNDSIAAAAAAAR